MASNSSVINLSIVKIDIPLNKYNQKCPYTMNPTRIVVHNTYNDASARNEVSYMQRVDRELSWHYAVDDIEAIQALPLDRNGWHAGDGLNGKGNREGIGIEICYSKSGGERYIKAEENAVQLIAWELYRRGWGIDKVTKHQDYSGKHCPHRILDEGRWNSFKQRIQDKLDDLKNGEKDTSSTGNATTEIKVGNKIKLKSTATNYATGQAIPQWVKNNSHTISKISNDRALLKEIVSWVYLKDVDGNSSSSSVSISDKGSKLSKVKETGVFVPNDNIYVRDYPSTKDGKIIKKIAKGTKVEYVNYFKGNGYVWLCWTQSGQVLYVPIREYKNSKYGEMWGTIS